MENMYYIGIKTPAGVECELGFWPTETKSAEGTVMMIAEYVKTYGIDLGMAKVVAIFMKAGQAQGLDVRETDGSMEMTKGTDRVQD
jgi:hypothetical protein